jgi:mycoredoxin
MTTQAAAIDRPIVYTTTWCGYCSRLKRELQRAGIGVTEIDIERNPNAAAVVEQLNDGDQTVPTVLFPDGSSLTNPSIREVADRLG